MTDLEIDKRIEYFNIHIRNQKNLRKVYRFDSAKQIEFRYDGYGYYYIYSYSKLIIRTNSIIRAMKIYHEL
jgi:hypothetical protein